MPRRLHILLLRSAHAVRLRWWKWRKTVVRGCRVVVIDRDDRVLLIRHSYGNPRWMLPGGGMRRSESACAAAAREAREEAGVVIDAAVEIDSVTRMAHGSGNAVTVVAGWSDDVPRPDGREIVAAAFFALDALPADCAPDLPELLPDYLRKAKAARSPPKHQA